MNAHAALACDDCLRRTWLLGRLSGHLDRHRGRIGEILNLPDEVLIAQVGGRHRRQLQDEFLRYSISDAARQRTTAAARGLRLICRCEQTYPRALRDLRAAPVVLHVTGELDSFLEACDRDPVAIVGSRSAGEYGRATAEQLARGIGAAGLTVISGLAAGIDAAAHRGALTAGACTIAVLPGSADKPLPAGNRALHRRILQSGFGVSELGPESTVRSWAYLARNRIIAALGSVSVVVQARDGSGSLVTISHTLALGRPVGAVPGQVDDRLSEGPNRLISNGTASLVAGARDVLDLVARARGEPGWAAAVRVKPRLSRRQQELLAAVGAGDGAVASILRATEMGVEALGGLSELELEGLVRREPGGRYRVIE